MAVAVGGPAPFGARPERDLQDREALARLRALEADLDPGTIRLLEALGPRAGWRCLEVGAGGGSIAAWLCRRVGPTGRVLATDPDPRFLDALAALDAPNLEVRRHDVATDELPARAFELVHTRGVLEHLPAPARAAALGRLAAALTPGGWLLAEAGDYVSWAPAAVCPAARAALFTEASTAVLRALPIDVFYGRHLAGDLQAQGLAEVAAEGRVALVHGASPAARSWRTAWAALGERIVASGVLTRQALAGFVALHDDPDFVWLGPVAVAAWGRRPLGPEGPEGPEAVAVQEDGRPTAAGSGNRHRPYEAGGAQDVRRSGTALLGPAHPRRDHPDLLPTPPTPYEACP
jgi:SAM-dependent methyltransferase